MKKSLFVVMIIVFNSCQTQELKFETEFMKYSIESMMEYGVDLKQEICKYENYLIEKGILKNNSGESYFNIYKQIEFSGDINYSFKYSFLDSLISKKKRSDRREVVEFLKITTKMKNSSNYKKSKLFELNRSLDSLKNNKLDIYPSDIARVIMQVLTPKELEHDYYKLSTMLLLEMTKNIEEDAITHRNLKEFKIPEQTVQIELTESNEIYILDSVIELKELKKRLEDSLNNEKKFFVLKVSRKTRYDFYVEIKSIINSVIENKRNEISLAKFEKEFKDISSDQKEIVEKFIPSLIEN